MRHHLAPEQLIEKMKPSLLTVEQVTDRLAASEPIEVIDFEAAPGVTITVEDGCHHGIDAKLGGDPINAYIELESSPGNCYQLTKDTLLQLGSICGIRRQYTAALPARLLAPQLNYWFREGLAAKAGNTKFRLLITGGTVAAVTKGKVEPFSNLRLLHEALYELKRIYPDVQPLIDPAFSHSLQSTHIYLIMPIPHLVLQTWQTDPWSIGLHIGNSLSGEDKTSIDGFAFRWRSGCGLIEPTISTGTWVRRTTTNGGEVYDWARAAITNIVTDMRLAIDTLPDLQGQPIEGKATDVLRDTFEHFHIPLSQRAAITEGFIAGDDPTLYGLVVAVCEAASRSEITDSQADSLMRIAGDLVRLGDARCGHCNRIIPH
jgi:hypothetical protein